MDMDGTLYPLRRLRWRFAWRAWRRQLGPLLRVSKAIQDEWLGRDFGDGMLWRTELTHQVAVRMGITINQATAGLRAVDDEVLAGSLSAASEDVRASLLQCSWPMAVVSDRPAIAAKLARLQLDRVPWCSLIGPDDTGALKPHPRVLQTAASLLGVDPECVLHLGDRDDTDGAAAGAVGAQFILCDGPADVVRALMLLR
jgi:FMN phosphatase YigB (HAD superfamily)